MEGRGEKVGCGYRNISGRETVSVSVYAVNSDTGDLPLWPSLCVVKKECAGSFVMPISCTCSDGAGVPHCPALSSGSPLFVQHTKSKDFPRRKLVAEFVSSAPWRLDGV